MKRLQVYKNIDVEREHQVAKYGEEGENATVKHFLYQIKRHTDTAQQYNCSEVPTDEVLAEVRKIAALAVACLEKYGVPERKNEQE
jgi:hypothetical protein